ncbi:MAG: hypothetical protein GY788_26580 [bacterium]|nr:hypothetical protein [bacterium]
MTGQYNAVQVRIQGGTATHRVAEYWRYDEPVLDMDASTHLDCVAVFGSQIGAILESFG